MYHLCDLSAVRTRCCKWFFDLLCLTYVFIQSIAIIWIWLFLYRIGLPSFVQLRMFVVWSADFKTKQIKSLAIYWFLNFFILWVIRGHKSNSALSAPCLDHRFFYLRAKNVFGWQWLFVSKLICIVKKKESNKMHNSYFCMLIGWCMWLKIDLPLCTIDATMLATV